MIWGYFGYPLLPTCFEDRGLGFSGSLVSQLCHKMGHKFVVILVLVSCIMCLHLLLWLLQLFYGSPKAETLCVSSQFQFTSNMVREKHFFKVTLNL